MVIALPCFLSEEQEASEYSSSEQCVLGAVTKEPCKARDAAFYAAYGVTANTQAACESVSCCWHVDQPGSGVCHEPGTTTAAPTPQSENASEYSSSCSDNGKLVIRIPYSNEKISDLLNFNAGTCSGSGELSENHLYHFDSDANHAVLSVDIEACGLSQILTEQPQLTRTTGNYFMATANVSIGAVLNGHEMSFYNEVVGAECGYQKEYTIEFDYRRKGQICL